MTDDFASRGSAGRIATGLAIRHWPGDAARLLPWVPSAYPEG